MTSRGKFEFGIQAFGSSIRIECANSEIRDVLDRYLFPPILHSENAPSSPDILIRVDQVAECFRVMVNHELAASVMTIHGAALAAVKALDDAVVHRMKAFRAVHAGAVLIEGRALIIPGSTHAGKSSLVAELLRRGAAHFSDEYALIDSEGRTHPYPRPLLLRNGRPMQSLVLPEELNATFATNPAPVGWILAVDYVPGTVWDVQEMSQGDAVMTLLRNTPHEMAQSPEMIDSFICLAGKAACFAGKRGDALEAASHILDLIGRK
jgi:hypothetical protein